MLLRFCSRQFSRIRETRPLIALRCAPASITSIFFYLVVCSSFQWIIEFAPWNSIRLYGKTHRERERESGSDSNMLRPLTFFWRFNYLVHMTNSKAVLYAYAVFIFFFGVWSTGNGHSVTDMQFHRIVYDERGLIIIKIVWYCGCAAVVFLFATMNERESVRALKLSRVCRNCKHTKWVLYSFEMLVWWDGCRFQSLLLLLLFTSQTRPHNYILVFFAIFCIHHLDNAKTDSRAWCAHNSSFLLHAIAAQFAWFCTKCGTNTFLWCRKVW